MLGSLHTSECRCGWLLNDLNYFQLLPYYLLLFNFKSLVLFQARERRDGVNTDYDQQGADLPSTTADYRAVAPDAKP